MRRIRFAAMVVRSQGAISGADILIHLIVGIVVWSTAGNRMVVERTGFRSRWSGNSSAAAVSELQHVDNTTSDVAGGWEPVELPDAEDLFADLEDASAKVSVHQDFVPSQEVVFMNPKFNSVATKPSSLSDQSLSFKRTAYVIALRHVHEMTADLKPPWQRELLASSVTRPKHFGSVFRCLRNCIWLDSQTMSHRIPQTAWCPCRYSKLDSLCSTSFLHAWCLHVTIFDMSL